MGVTTTRASAPDAQPDYATFSIEELVAAEAAASAQRTQIRLTQNAIADALAAARLLEGLTPDQRAALKARQ